MLSTQMKRVLPVANQSFRSFHKSITLNMRVRNKVQADGYQKDVQIKYDHTIKDIPEGEQKEATDESLKQPRRIIIGDFIPGKKHLTHSQFKQPLKIDKKGNPVYSDRPQYEKSRYPAIEKDPIIVPKRERYLWEPQSKDSQQHQVEFRGNFTSDELIEAGVDDNPLIKQLLSWNNASQKEINQRNKAIAVKRFQRAAGDTGSTPVQIACLTEKINYLTVHMQKNHKDNTTKRTLQKMTHRRRRLMMYLRKTEPEQYWKTVRGLNLRITLDAAEQYNKV
ncbi:ribosomal protein S15 [Acrasis kona]|uniref:Ribosomal protein S15 n=1 Tax=Acrasis kona TaxID=1008807 RepID=A0AAW2ZBM1_9EUKA